MRRVLSVAAAVLIVAGCAHPPKNLAGEFAPVTVAEAQRQPRQGEAVRWGGTLVSATPERNRTCFEVVSRPLDREARPEPSDQSAGRFVACAPGFYDPSVYAAGRDLTVVGALHGVTTGKVGGYDYTYPLVDATTVHLWEVPRRQSGWSPGVGISIGGAVGHW